MTIADYAAAFFLLGGSLKDAVNVCLKNLQDFQLAIALARVVEQDEEGPVFKEILTSTVIPTAFKEGNRWLASWAFWLLNRRDLAVRILVVGILSAAMVTCTFCLICFSVPLFRLYFKIWQKCGEYPSPKLENPITMTQVWHSCSQSSSLKLCRRRKERARSRAERSSTLFYRCLGSFVGWVRRISCFPVKID